MTLGIITKAVSRRLTDESISVREAAVSLVGTHVVQSPAIANSFQSSLMVCLSDPGVSVRKRAVKIFQAILTTNPRFRGRSSVCDIMLRRAADPKEEDAVRDLIHDLFTKLWLENGQALVKSSNGINGTDSNGRIAANHLTIDAVYSAVDGSVPGVVTPNSPDDREVKSPVNRKRVDIAAEQMMEVVRAGGSSDHLETLLKKLLKVADADKALEKSQRKKSAEISHRQCDDLVHSLFELLVSVEERRQNQPSCIGKDLAATLQTITAFVEFAPETVLNHLDMIMPYLKADNGVSSDEEPLILAATCDIIYRVTSVLGSRATMRLTSSSLANDLVKITYNFGPVPTEAAIRALSSIIRYKEASENCVLNKKLLDLSARFYEFLFKHHETKDVVLGDVS